MQAESQSRVALVVGSVLSFYKRDTCRSSQFGELPSRPRPLVMHAKPRSARPLLHDDHDPLSLNAPNFAILHLVWVESSAQ